MLQSGEGLDDRFSTLLHSEQPKLHRVLAVLSAIGLFFFILHKKNIYFVTPYWNFITMRGHRGVTVCIFNQKLQTNQSSR